jgi:hydroxyacylglutathione hydrolase
VDVTPVVDEGLGNSAYVVDLGDGGALVVDPERDPRPYAVELERRGLTPRWVVETHLHADFVSGGRELTARGAQLAAPVGSELAFPHRALKDGDELDLGGMTLEAIATPGHTPEHVAYLLRDGRRPLALFSGGTLMAGGVARTDLLSPDMTEPLARQAYRSIHQRLFTLADELPVYPTHGAGSFCSAAPGGQRTSTIGTEKAANPLLVDQPDEDTFVARLLGGYGSYPPYFLELRDVNRAGVVVVGQRPPALPRLSPDEVGQTVGEGAVLVDVRRIAAFAAGHVPGAISNPWRAQFATWLGWLVSREATVILVPDPGVAEEDLVWAALTIGFQRLAGVLDGGIDAWATSGRPVATTPLVDADAAAGRRVVDIRQRPEYAAGHVAGAFHVELGELTELDEVTGDAPPFGEGPVLVHCGQGERAMSAASLLERAGHRDVAVLAGGPDDLADADHGLETGA